MDSVPDRDRKSVSSRKHPDKIWVQQAPYSLSSGALSWDENDRGVKLTNQLLVTPRLNCIGQTGLPHPFKLTFTDEQGKRCPTEVQGWTFNMKASPGVR